jgi:hypothetical protein
MATKTKTKEIIPTSTENLIMDMFIKTDNTNGTTPNFRVDISAEEMRQKYVIHPELFDPEFMSNFDLFKSDRFIAEASIEGYELKSVRIKNRNLY